MSSGNILAGAGDPLARQPQPAPSHYDLRPLSTGEILDRTFQLYRSRFALFAGLAILPAAVNVVTQALRLWYAAHQSLHTHPGVNIYMVQGITGILTMLSGIIALVLYGITQAATAWAVSNVYLGEPATISTAFASAKPQWFRYTLIVLRQVWAIMWVPLLILGLGFIPMAIAGRKTPASAMALGFAIFLVFPALVYGFWAYLRVSLAVPATVVEQLGVRAALKRSTQLLVSRKGRIFLLFLLLFVLYMVIGAIQVPLAVLALKSRGVQAFTTQAISLALNFATATLVGPIGAIALCLFYFDERVRREGFDIEWMMSKVAPTPVQPATSGSGDTTASPIS